MADFRIQNNNSAIVCRVKFGNDPETNGTVVRQKSTKKFIVTDGSRQHLCSVVDLDDGQLLPDTMTISLVNNDNKVERIEYLTPKFAVNFDKKRYIINGANPDSIETAVVITEDYVDTKKTTTKSTAKKKNTKSTAKKTTTKSTAKKKTTKAKTTKKPVKKVEKVDEEEIQTKTSDNTISTFSIVQN